MKKNILICLMGTLCFIKTTIAQNLLVNGSFEQGSVNTGNGAFSMTGWKGNYYGYNSAGTSTGGASDGNQKFNLATGSLIETDNSSLITVTPNSLYKLTFDLQTYSNSQPSQYLGTYGYIV